MAGIDNNTLLYLRGDSFEDLSLNPKSIVNHGATLDTNSNVIDLNNGGVSTPYTSDFKLQEFTYEGWFKADNNSFFFCIGGQSGYYSGDVEIRANDNGELLAIFSNLNNSQGTQSKNPSFKSDNMNTPNVWMYLAMVYKNKSMNIFINGKKVLTYENITLNYRGSSYFVSIGYRLSETVIKCKGYCKNIRISNVARYTENFTPPTQSFNSITINKTNQTDTNIEFNIEKLGQETINKVEVLQDNVVKETYTDNYDNLSYAVDKELCVIGNNYITIRVTYDNNYAEEKVITYKHTVPPLPQEAPLLDTVERVKALVNSKEAEKNLLSNMLTSKNVEVSEEDKMSDLIVKVDLLGEYESNTLWLYKDGKEFVNITGEYKLEPYTYGDYITVPTIKNLDNFHLIPNGKPKYSAIVHSNKINVSSYKTLNIEIEVLKGVGNDEYSRIGLSSSNSSHEGFVAYISNMPQGIKKVIQIDISNISGEYYFKSTMACYTSASSPYANYKIYKIWLEK